MITKAISFWHFLSKYSIEIPIIQRDYAQGRSGIVIKLRQSFLENIRQALDGEKTIKLDFVYGSEKQGVLYPLDGQQRLTTLWLLHWYIALVADKLTVASSVLSKFTYETRISSREFCRQLCIPDNFASYKGEDIVAFIKKQTWFYAEWDQDPTVQSMLRMLGGTDVKDKNDNDYKDGIEEFLDCSKASIYWELLTGHNSPIVFYHLPLSDFGLSDDLYIKMNARGKPLTSFENFKADLLGHVKNLCENDITMQRLEQDFSRWLDNDWTNYFWKRKSVGLMKDGKLFSDNRIDEIYFAFINRFLWCERILKSKDDAIFVYLNQDRYDAYNGFAQYKFIDGQILSGLSTVLNNLISYSGKWPEYILAKDFEFVPMYRKEGSYNVEKAAGILEVSSLNQIERIAFFALCKYFKEGAGDQDSLERWMRVVWNLISGKSVDDKPQIRDLDAVRGAINFIASLDSHAVYESLANQNLANKEKSEFVKRCIEEQEKALQILSDTEGQWEDKIKDAESIEFLRGSIRSLYHDEAGICWEHFDAKLQRAKKYFQTPMNGIELLKRLFSKFSQQNVTDTIWWWYKTFKPTNGVWLYYLNHDLLSGPVHHLLMDDDTTPIDMAKGEGNMLILYYLSMTNILDVINEKIPDAWLRIPHSYTALYYRSHGVFMTATSRDSLLIDNPDVVISDKIRITETQTGKTCLLYGFDVNFSYAGSNFCWNRDGYIYLMAKDNENSYLEKMDGNDKYYRCETSQLNENTFLSELQKLVTDYEHS